MIPSFTAVLPALDETLARKCVDSMCPLLRANLIVVDNTDDGMIASRYADTDVGWVRAQHENIGVARAWNVGCAMADLESSDYLVIVSQSITFGPPGGMDFLTELEQRKPKHICASQHGWKCLALNRANVLDVVGWFDPVFSPGYWDDTDYLLRLARAALPSPRENGGELDQVVIDATNAGNGLMLERAGISLVAQENRYVAKWGGVQGHERFEHPYNNPLLDFTHTGPPPD